MNSALRTYEYNSLKHLPRHPLVRRSRGPLAEELLGDPIAQSPIALPLRFVVELVGGRLLREVRARLLVIEDIERLDARDTWLQHKQQALRGLQIAHARERRVHRLVMVGPELLGRAKVLAHRRIDDGR